METMGSVEEMKQYARRFVEGITPRASEATVVGLSGELGSGKTTFVQGVARALSVEEPVTSPTFVIMKAYDIKPKTKNQKQKTFNRLLHVDAYRLDHGQELTDLGWKALLSEKSTLILLEWPERVKDILPKTMHTLHFTFINENTRGITENV